MDIIIPLGGIGSRFKKVGYNLPKPLINVMGKPILFWLLDNLNLEKVDNIIIPYNFEIKKFNFEDRIKKRYPYYNFIFKVLEDNTDGAAETLLIALKDLDIDDKPIISLDGDNFYTEDIISKWNKDNCVFVFEDKSKEEVYSYIKIKDKNVTDIFEKNKISNLACSGAYGFKSRKELISYCDFIVKNKIMQKNEFYTSTVIKKMIQQNNIFNYQIININNYICLGTPIHVRLFCNNFPKINADTNKEMFISKRYCFDLDNTLVTFPKVYGDYSTVEPIEKNINIVRYLKKLGHTIIIYTARRMKTHKSNKGKVMKDIGNITFKNLEDFNIPHDEIYFGKPYADFYIDDLAISSYSDLEKELGFYRSMINPRDFNSIKKTSVMTYLKESDDLSGEIHWYNNIPLKIKDMFPIMFNHDVNFKWYEMEKINGIPISKIFLSEELTENKLNHIIGSLERIHNSEKKKELGIKIYKNYNVKMKKRYESYNYSYFNNSKKLYNILTEYFKSYENENKGVIGVTHGDPVFTNILINQFGKIKLIDMRGKIDDKLTIYGDTNYDWAKLYQSLIGYDEILDNKFISKNYKNNLIDIFESYILKKYNKEKLEHIKMITKLLLFTLIPLHDNNKCNEYYNLISKIN